RGKARGDEVDQHLVLGVEVDGAADERREVDAVALALEAQFDAVVLVAVAQHAVAHARAHEHVDGALLEDAGADGLLDVLAAALVDHDRGDARAVEEVGEQEAGRAGPDDADLGADRFGHGDSFVSAARCRECQWRPVVGPAAIVDSPGSSTNSFLVQWEKFRESRNARVIPVEADLRYMTTVPKSPWSRGSTTESAAIVPPPGPLTGTATPTDSGAM